jgi:hypothetical protein
MPGEQPYNELGQILASGGEIALGLAIAKGWTGSQIALLFARRFDPMRPEDRDRLIDLANRALQAASDISDMPPDADIDPSGIPTNPYLFGDDPSGRRAKVAGRFTVDEGVNWFDYRHDISDITNREQMLNEIQAAIEQDWSKYPEGGGKKFGGPMEHLTIELTLTEKRF